MQPVISVRWSDSPSNLASEVPSSRTPSVGEIIVAALHSVSALPKKLCCIVRPQKCGRRHHNYEFDIHCERNAIQGTYIVSDAKDDHDSYEAAGVEKTQLSRDIYALVLFFGVRELFGKH
jgi:hypothetical protein